MDSAERRDSDRDNSHWQPEVAALCSKSEAARARSRPTVRLRVSLAGPGSELQVSKNVIISGHHDTSVDSNIRVMMELDVTSCKNVMVIMMMQVFKLIQIVP
jgi:hypothetical protein